ncbi:predicted protein [Uncinocarpus reesii 1704]|uniref:Uncharacterized protein n=1 Tax=Uncinocarpus reesii (strain UAMH 1704) TaxID=336963 RepID=C4JEX5_UNCRE|nr:uncharacterized protein UREG_00875 [Uncinocarpus reesii 1704]EEP76028.1 predicted protein [Uncinocarpus reesii 1704]
MPEEGKSKAALARDINNLVTLASTTNVEPMCYSHQAQANWPRTKFSQRFTLQDAIATVLLDGRRGEMYAVGLQVDHDEDPSKRAIVAYISTNQKVTLAKTIYLEDVFNILQKRARVYEDFLTKKTLFEQQCSRAEAGGPKVTVEEPSLSPNLLHDLMRLVYRHCFKGWIKSIHNSIADMNRFKATMMSIVGDGLDGSDPNFYLWLEPLTYLIEQFDWVYESTDSYLQQERDPRDLVSHPDFVSKIDRLESAYRVFERDREALDKIEEWHALNQDTEEPITTHLRRFVDFQIAIEQLIRVSQLPKAIHFLRDKSLEIVYIDDFNKLPIKTTLPTDVGSWEAILAQALEYNDLRIKPDQKAGVDRHLAALSEIASRHPTGRKPTVHPPTQLLQFFATHQIHPPPLSIIGSSQPVCAACASLFTAWHCLFEYPSYISRASDGRYPFPWNVPTEWVGSRIGDDRDVLEMVYSRLAERLGTALSDAGIAEPAGSEDSQAEGVREGGNELGSKDSGGGMEGHDAWDVGRDEKSDINVEVVVVAPEEDEGDGRLVTIME